MFDKFMGKAVKASFWMIGAWGAWMGFAVTVAAIDRGNQALHEYLCEAPNHVVIAWSRDDKGNLQRKRACRPPVPEDQVIHVIRDADGKLVRSK